MRCTELIAAMAAKGYWTSPGGKTPASTLYSALLRPRKIRPAFARPNAASLAWPSPKRRSVRPRWRTSRPGAGRWA
jgi:hypothetical protein